MGSPISKAVEKALEVFFDINEAGHTTANVGILATGTHLSPTGELILHGAIVIAFIGLMWRFARWCTRRWRGLRARNAIDVVDGERSEPNIAESLSKLD